MVSVIFPAAGQGTRMKAGKNKVLLELAGQPILLRTLQAFSAVPEVGELIVVTGREEMEEVRAMLERAGNLKPWQLVEGSTERQYSIRNGLACVAKEAELVLVHDAARPLVTEEVIARVIEGARQFGGAIAAVPEKKAAVKERQDAVTQTVGPKLQQTGNRDGSVRLSAGQMRQLIRSGKQELGNIR